MNKRTKIITTIGPASESYETIKKLYEAGMNTIRLNFSHGDQEEQMRRANNARKLSADIQKPISVMLDTKGPEIRVGKFIGGKQQFTSNQKVTIYTDEKSYENKECLSGEITVSYDMSVDLQAGKIVLIDDGKLQIDVTEVKPGVVKGTTRNAHMVKTNKRVNLPGTKFSMPFLAEKDINDIKLAAREKMDYIAASFVNTPEDVHHIKRILQEEGAPEIKVISKIESQYGVDHYDEILAASDGIMVARGDLGLEIPYYEVPVVQKMMIRKARDAGKPIIVATQMLDSMENNPHPTRAEVTDVYIATEMGADATMLSGESAAGQYPVQAVAVMNLIDCRAEKEFYNKIYYAEYLKTLPLTVKGSRQDKAKHVALSTATGEFKFAVVLSRTGELLTAVSAFRPNVDILGVSPDPRQYTLHGITSSVFMHNDTKAFAAIKADKSKAAEVVKAWGGKPGDKYLVVENENISEFTL